MFESAELGHTIDDKHYKSKATALRAELLDVQYQLLERAKFPVVVLINGVEGAGKGETVNLLGEWMDPRLIRAIAFGAPSEDERARPPMWRYWQALPPKGRIGVLFGSWYTEPIVRRASKEISQADFDQRLERIVHFERMLAADGALLLKFWFHLSKDAQRTRLKELERNKDTRWRVTKADWKAFGKYDTYRKVSERALRITSREEAPWTIVEGANANFRNLTVGATLHDAIATRLAQKAPRVSSHAPPIERPIDGVERLQALTFTERLSKEKFERQLPKEQRRLHELTMHPKFKDRSVIMVFEGNDAAGKGGAIRRVTGALDARHYRVIPIAAPTEEERAQHYLWRFWRHMPKVGSFTIFDRSWYGRVLVERVEGFASQDAWMRAYSEINDFEEQLARAGGILVKCWLAVTKDEQLRRFKERERTRFKRFKITKEDWRNRDKWGAYEQAANDMLDRTSTDIAPWTIVEANDKHLARIKTLRALADTIEAKL